MTEAKQPIIIVGLSRSGTSYLSRLLTANGVQMCEWEMHGVEEADIYCVNLVEHLTNAPDESVIPFAHNPSTQFVDRLRWFRSRREGSATWGFKEPMIFEFLPVYAELWPNAKYITCVRNAMSTAWSIKRRLPGAEDMTDQQLIHKLAMRLAHICAVVATSKIQMHYFNYDAEPMREFVALSGYLGLELKGWDTFKAVQSSRSIEFTQ